MLCQMRPAWPANGGLLHGDVADVEFTHEQATCLIILAICLPHCKSPISITNSPTHTPPLHITNHKPSSILNGDHEGRYLKITQS